MTIVIGTIVQLCLMIYLLAHIIQIKTTLTGHEVVVAESPFFGIMQSGLGRLVIWATLFVIPGGVCVFVLLFAFPTFKAEWLGLRWLAGTAFQWVLIIAVNATGALLVWQVDSTTAALRRKDAGCIGADLE